MLMRERPLAPAGLLPTPAPLPSLTAAFSRRSALFGAVTASGALACSAAHAGVLTQVAPDLADARLTALGAEVDRILDGAAYALAPIEAPDQDARLDRADALLKLMAEIPAAAAAGLYAKAKAWLDSDSYDVQEGAALAESMANDIERMHRAGWLA